MRKLIVAIAAAALTVGVTYVPTVATGAEVRSGVTIQAAKYKFKNCTALNKVYPHGVGRSNAKDKTSGKPVTNFVHNTSLYKKIIKYRKSLDRDKDGIACEKA